MARPRLSGGVIALIVIDVILILVLIALLVTHPRQARDPEPTDTGPIPTDGIPSPGEGENGPDDEDPDPLSPPPEDALEESRFAMPSRNIWCELRTDEALCSIASFTYSAPSDPDCDGEVGAVVRLTADGATLPCVADGVAEAAPEAFPSLAYGATTANESFWCQSAEAGVTCRSIETGRGFSLSRGGFATF